MGPSLNTTGGYTKQSVCACYVCCLRVLFVCNLLQVKTQSLKLCWGGDTTHPHPALSHTNSVCSFPVHTDSRAATPNSLAVCCTRWHHG
jgi:hypothetical protein